VPTLADDVSILSSGITVVNQQGSAAANSLMSCADLAINGSMTIGRVVNLGTINLQSGALNTQAGQYTGNQPVGPGTLNGQQIN
jgi:hypothetical protein